MVIDKRLDNVIREAANQLKQKNIDDPLQEARFLMQEILQIPIAKQLARPDILLTEIEYKQFCQATTKRASGTPAAYITGKADFYGNEFLVNNTLIPRPETELLIDLALTLSFDTKEISILDLCTGSGCIGITLFLNLYSKYQIELSLSDISTEALMTCQKNVERLIKKQSNIQILEADLFPKQDTNKPYDLIVVNPPYIETKTIDDLQIDVKDYEPKLALDGGADGLLFYKRLATEIKPYLSSNKNTYLLLEHGLGQRDAIKDIFEKSEFQILDIIEINDWQKFDRILGFTLKL